MTTRPHVLVLGAGSVGQRHARNLATLGCDISLMDPRADRRAVELPGINVLGRHASVSEALAAGGFSGSVIGSPTAFHEAQLTALIQARVPVLLEKPPAMSLAEATRMRELTAGAGVPVLLGYTYRWWEPLRFVRRLIADGAIGRVLHVTCAMSAHLADWHPWERYQDFFMASKALGGGALLDESHMVDLAVWLFGTPASVMAEVHRVSDLEIDCDDCVDAVMRYADGKTVSIHLDLFGRPHTRAITFRGQAGSIEWTVDPNRVRLAAEHTSGVWVTHDFQDERNDMFLGVAREFIEVIHGRVMPSCTIDDGVAVMAVLDAMVDSSRTGRRVVIG